MVYGVNGEQHAYTDTHLPSKGSVSLEISNQCEVCNNLVYFVIIDTFTYYYIGQLM